jgi:PEP-CTERM motif
MAPRKTAAALLSAHQLCDGQIGEGLVSCGEVLSTPVLPEPSTWAMMALGIAGLGFVAFMRRKEGPRSI